MAGGSIAEYGAGRDIWVAQVWFAIDRLAAMTELNQLAVSASYKKDIGNVPVQMKNDRVELEMKIIQIRLQARKANDITRKRLDALAAVLEQKLREMDS